ncbi:MAG: IMP dehydrogenase [Polyangiaceae bacterium]
MKSRVTRAIELNILLVSAAMDSVTEACAAVMMARQGGIGIVHKNLPPRDQAHEVDRPSVPRAGSSSTSVTVRPSQSLREALTVMREHDVSGVPVEGDSPVGILTARDIRFEKNLDQPVSALMTTDLVTVSPGVRTTPRASLHKHRIEKLLVARCGKLIGLITIGATCFRAERESLRARDERGRLRWAPPSDPAPKACSARTCWSKPAWI